MNNVVATPALPQAQKEYSTAYQDQLNSVLRLYFNRLNGFLNNLSVVYTVATLPSAVSSGAGTRAFVSDANSTTFASTVVGGGSNIVPVYSNGTVWKIG
jgi:hypothetical protein